VPFTKITITGDYVAPDGSLVSGACIFQLQDPDDVTKDDASGMTDSVTGEIVVPQPVMGIIHQGKLLTNPAGGGGFIPLVLLAVDDPDTIPVNCFYLVTEKLTAGSLAPWKLTVHADAPNATLDIGSQRPQP
jgi:hypothetical protein